MFQRFHDISMFSNLVKNLLSSEPLPIYDVVKGDSILIPGCSYVYQDTVIRCLSNPEAKTLQTLLDIQLENTSKNYIEFLDRPAYHVRHTSNVSWYDSDTHKHLGDYLRYLRDVKDLNLLKFYNCYSGVELTDVYLDTTKKTSLVCSEGLYVQAPPKLYCGANMLTTNDKTYKFGSKLNSKVLAIPIKFDTDYTIAIESANPVSLRAVIYNPNTGMVKKRASDMSYYSDDLEYTSKNYAHTMFNKPITYRVDLATVGSGMSEETKRLLYSRQSELYLLIQVAADLGSSVVVLEGKYSKNTYTYVYGAVNTGDLQEVTSYSDNLSLLHYNTGISYAFSDRLVEYILQNVVSCVETLPLNIARVQESLGVVQPAYTNRLHSKEALLGVWDDEIPNFIRRVFEEHGSDLANPYDQDGNINKDVEYLLSLKGGYIT